MGASRSQRSAQSGKSGGDKSRNGAARAAKRAQFTDQQRRPVLPYVLVALAVIAAAVAGAVYAAGGGEGAAPAGTAAAPAPVDGGRVSVPLADLADGEARFFSADVDGSAVEYFVVQDADGKVRTAFDACDVCYPAKKGYTQDGDVMVCNNCGRRFAVKGIGTVAGGCNPSPLEAKVRDGEVVITADALAEGVGYFQ
jgi:uncharacterized membrane protein